jgi:predicted TIM-barrel fold metal-dependent hydrolase
MDGAGIETSVVCSIATKIDQFEPILGWCRQIRSDRLIPFPSVHPADPKMAEHIDRIAAEGFLGVKLHPFYQDFYAGPDAMLKYYEQVIRRDLLLVIHTGFDIAFPRQRRADPRTIRQVSERFPELRLVATHLGPGNSGTRSPLSPRRPIHMEISLAMEDLGDAASREMLLSHPPGYLLFGTDSPMVGPGDHAFAAERPVPSAGETVADGLPQRGGSVGSACQIE